MANAATRSPGGPVAPPVLDGEAPARITPALLSAAQCAAMCSVSRASWFSWQSTGFAPAAVLRRGHIVRWSRAEIERWISFSCPPRDRFEGMRGVRP